MWWPERKVTFNKNKPKSNNNNKIETKDFRVDDGSYYLTEKSICRSLYIVPCLFQGPKKKNTTHIQYSSRFSFDEDEMKTRILPQRLIPCKTHRNKRSNSL